MTSWSLRARLTVWYSVALLVVLSLFGATVIWQQGRVAIRRVDFELDDLTNTLTSVFLEEIGEVPILDAAVEAQQTMAAPGRTVAILEADTAQASFKDAGRFGSLPELNGRRQAWTAATREGPWRLLAQLRDFSGHPFILVVGVPLADILRERREAQEAILLGIPVALLLAAGGGFWLASAGLRPIAHMARRAIEIPAQGTDDLGSFERKDELGQLARAFNGLLARLRQVLTTQRQFMADASHELRTPVSVIRSAADVTLARESRNETEYREALGIVAAQSRLLGSLVEGMLVLARADAGGYPLRRVNLYLNELAAECQRTIGVLAQQRGVTIRATTSVDVPYYGDEDLLRRMLMNLVQNAVQHSSPGSDVTVETTPHVHQVVIRVIDRGPGIPEADRVRIFDRFVQLDPARRTAGAGLGLPIARWIAEAHQGTIELERSGPDGSTFRVVLPL